MKDLYKLFKVRNFDNTAIKHAERVDRLNARMEELGIDYSDILDSNAWQTIDSQVEQKLSLWESMGNDIMTTQKSKARLINELTRQAIRGGFEYYEIPASYDTAFFVAHYMKTIEGMAEILEGINYRGETK